MDTLHASTVNPSMGKHDDTRWTAVTARDPNADGSFVFAVRTTGVYCRPSCPARRPLRKNVSFYRSPVQARQAGYRPCKRCRPDQPSLREQYAGMVERACRTIESAETPPALAQLAREAGMSPFHFHRVFKSVTGVTPRNYAAALRSRRAREGLARGGKVTRTLFDAGFNSSGRFYETAPAMLGMTPSRYRAGGASTSIEFATGRSALGMVLVARTDRGICAIQLGDSTAQLERELRVRFPKAELRRAGRIFDALLREVIAKVEDPSRSAKLPLDIQGTAFQQQVWEALRNIPAGKTRSYADIARRIGKPAAVRAVARACAANKLAVLIPCHRVVRSDGSLSGYRWGVTRKKALLAREQQAK